MMTFDLKLNENTMDATNENLNRHLNDGIHLSGLA